jgi:glycosyltransferase
MAINFEYPFKSKDFFEYVNYFEKYKDVKSNLLFSDVKSQDPLVSVVIPTYKAPYIKEALDSVLRQTEAPDYEVVIVENDPGNSSLLEYVKSLNSGRIRYYCNEENIGAAGNWNRCIELARSEDIVFCHSDDMLLEDTLKNLWAFRQKFGPKAAILGRSRAVDAYGHIIRKDNTCKDRFAGLLKAKPYYLNDIYSLFMLDFSNGVGEMFSRSVLMRIGGYNPDFYPAIDFVMLMNYFRFASMYRINQITRIGRVAVNTSLTVSSKFAACNFYMQRAIVDKYFGGNRFFHYMGRLASESAGQEQLNFFPARKLNLLEKVMVRMSVIVYNLHAKYYWIINNWNSER